MPRATKALLSHLEHSLTSALGSSKLNQRRYKQKTIVRIEGTHDEGQKVSRSSAEKDNVLMSRFLVHCLDMTVTSASEAIEYGLFTCIRGI